ncbi:hypothetical protein RJ639_034098 [Escallonia herrerae]|uniref:Retrotransposon Copia-like N-terminal domain-containing protein n=1 Tax=Escallonia herrerae TaxID=1293975 RepID=A0AA88WWL7_9ASTE|nr:hypothetical protein RJ639_034098 [Escallonia herrerae]
MVKAKDLGHCWPRKICASLLGVYSVANNTWSLLGDTSLRGSIMDELHSSSGKKHLIESDGEILLANHDIEEGIGASTVMEDESASYVHGGLAPVANVQNIAIDTKSPFYLHPSDHPGLIFVTQPLSKNGENYFTWRRNMLTSLQSKNKAGFVDGLIAKPDCNAVVKSWIVNSLSRELQTGAAHADTASEIWCDFDERFTQGIALRVYDLKRSIALLQQEKFAISTYYGKLKGVWNELHNLRPILVCTCGAGKKMQEMREEEKVFDFLMGLDDTYKTVRSQILSIDPLPGLGRAYVVAAQEEK